MGRAVILDRDGVLNENRDDYVKSWTEFRFLPGALDALCLLAASNFAIIVVTNQSGIGRGRFSSEELEDIHKRMISTIVVAGGRIDAILYCPHLPEDRCECRKPNPGLLLKAAELFGIDLKASYNVGDKLSDLEAGRLVGCRNIAVKTGKWQEQNPRSFSGEFLLVNDLREAVDFLLAKE